MKISIRGEIIPSDIKWAYDWLGYDATCPKDIQTAILEAKGEALEVEINSPGGDVFSGSEIYSLLRKYEGKVTIHVVGVAASAASLIAMAGECHMAPSALMMVHNVSGMAQGDYRVMDRSAEVLKTANKALAEAYRAKSGLGEKEILALMDKETWLTAAQAKEKGLADGILFENAGLGLVASGCSMLSGPVIERLKALMNREDLMTDYELLEIGGFRQ